jgi:hypothetical protein
VKGVGDVAVAALSTERKGTVGAFVVRPYRTTDQQRDCAALVCHLPAAR